MQSNQEHDEGLGDINPYDATTHADATGMYPPKRVSVLRSLFTGAIWSVVSAFPIAAMMGLVYRFPIPFRGYVSGFEAIMPSFGAVVFYGVIGGFALLGGLGAVGGFLAGRFSSASYRKQLWAIRLTSMVITTAGVFILAILDKIIGPW